tara:strand:- start:12 stop:509 length:498 start_codon:yes stop_codon:yes gene_type:complete
MKLLREYIRSLLTESVEIIEDDWPGITWRVQDYGNGISAVLMMSGQKMGSIIAREVLRWKYCADDVEKLKAQGYDYEDPRWPSLGPQLFAVGNSEIDQAFRGQGWGKKMYKVLIDAIGKKAGDRGAFVGADECAAGSTSKDAQRVWKSLARDYPSSGNVVYVGPK